MVRICRRSAAVVLFLMSATASLADVRLPQVLASHMVLQRDLAAPLWGWADPGEQVVVSMDGHRAQTEAGADGKWLLRLPPRPAGGPVVITVEGKNKLTLQDVLFGDVWICSGQSNMAWRLSMSANASQDTATASHPRMRLFSVPLEANDQAQEDCSGKWQVCSPATAPRFSAVGYYFGRALHQALDVPIGLVNASYGGTPAEAWTPRATLQANPAFGDLLERERAYQDDYPQAIERYEAALAQWQQAAASARAQGQDEPPKPRKPPTPQQSPILAARLYNAMIHPLIPLGIKGVIWYQGENNVGRAEQYATLLPAMIEGWRSAWGQGDFPFGLVQLAGYRPGGAEPNVSHWALLREAQARVARQTPHCGLITAVDLGNARNIHPTNKHDVGGRLSRWALACAYQQAVEHRGPEFKAMSIEADAVRITFQQAEGGLVVKDDGPIEGFTIAGADRRFVPAQATLAPDGVSVLVRSTDVANPVAVRYAWANHPTCSLYNHAGLPALPFRTDDWPATAK